MASTTRLLLLRCTASPLLQMDSVSVAQRLSRRQLFYLSTRQFNLQASSQSDKPRPNSYFTSDDDERSDKERFYWEEFGQTESTEKQSTETAEIQGKIIQSTMKLLPVHGFTIETLGRAAEMSGLPYTAHGLFPNGPMHIVDHIMRQGKLNMAEKFQSTREEMDRNGHRLGMTASVRFLCQYRLSYMKPFIRQWHDALAVMGQPQNIPRSLQHLAELTDEIWHLAGDKSYDFNYYTKRVLLSGVYTSTELYMVHDTSPDFEATWKFLDRRLEDTAMFGKTISDVINYGGFVLKSWEGILASRGILK